MNSLTVKIKICGLTRYEDAALAAQLGAWGLGFIFSDNSPRSCPVKVAGEIIQRLEKDQIEVEKVGVFLDQPAEEVNRIAAEVGLTFAQLHGSESPVDCARVEVKVLKAIQQLNLNDPEILDAYPYWLLMDATRAGDNWGGTGHIADWLQAKTIARRYPLFLAGNLGSDNIVQALEAVHPFGVDLSSSIEVSPGIKDHDKLRQLFHVLKDAGYIR
ncbi:MAG: phosphoribosylanthranilate isomerase [Gammaproteobacteria bacterium]